MRLNTTSQFSSKNKRTDEQSLIITLGLNHKKSREKVNFIVSIEVAIAHVRCGNTISAKAIFSNNNFRLQIRFLHTELPPQNPYNLCNINCYPSIISQTQYKCKRIFSKIINFQIFKNVLKNVYKKLTILVKIQENTVPKPPYIMYIIL